MPGYWLVKTEPSTYSFDDLKDRKSTRLNSSHTVISYAVFCLEKKNTRLNSSHPVISYAVFCLIKDLDTSMELLTDDNVVPFVKHILAGEHDVEKSQYIPLTQA